MLPFDHDASSLRTALAVDFDAISLNIKLKSEAEMVVDFLLDSTRRILLDQLCKWNQRSLISKLSDRLLALCLEFLPYRERLAASHVSRAWREASVRYPVVWTDSDILAYYRNLPNFLPDSTRRNVLDRLGKWNQRSLISKLPDELLALCFAFLPFHDRFFAPHVSRAWRDISLHYPAVWSDIEISSKSNYRDLPALLDLAVLRSKDAPIDLIWSTYREFPSDLRSGLPLAVQGHTHRLRSIVWHTYHRITLDDPLPLLEEFEAYYGYLSARFLELSGALGRLHTLHIRLCFLPPNFAGSIDSVRDLEVSLSLEDDNTQVGMLPHLFARFPRIESFALTEILDEQMPIMPTRPLPRSLDRLRLSACQIDDPAAGDLVALCARWKTAQLPAVEVCCNPGPIQDESAARSVRPLFAGAVELHVCERVSELAVVKIAATDAAGRTRALVFQEGVWNNEPNPHERLARAIWLSMGDFYNVLRSIALEGQELDGLMKLGGSCGFPAVHTLCIYLEATPPTTPVRQPWSEEPHSPELCEATWSSLCVLGRMPKSFPALTSCCLDPHSLITWRAQEHHHAACARALVAQIATHVVPGHGLPVLHIRGFSREVIHAVDPHEFEHLSAQIEFDPPHQPQPAR